MTTTATVHLDWHTTRGKLIQRSRCKSYGAHGGKRGVGRWGWRLAYRARRCRFRVAERGRAKRPRRPTGVLGRRSFCWVVNNTYRHRPTQRIGELRLREYGPFYTYIHPPAHYSQTQSLIHFFYVLISLIQILNSYISLKYT